MYHQKYKYKLLTFDVYSTIGNKSGEEFNTLDKQRYTKHQTENQRSSNTNPTKNT
jgi:hypothetical protein